MPTARDGSRAPLVLGAVCALMWLNPAYSQPQPAPATGAVEFDEEPFRIDSIGLTMLLPVGCKAEGGTAGGKSAITVTSPDTTWLCNVQNPRLSVADRSAKQLLTDVMTEVLRHGGEIFDKDKKNQGPLAFKGEILTDQETVVIGDKAAERVYLKLPGQGSGPAVVRGYTIFQISTNQFATFELVTTEPLFTSARREYETMVGTVKFEDPAQVNADRAAAIKTGLKVFERVDEGTLREIVQAQPERWERLYKPSPTGARADDDEVGYRRIRMSIGKRGDLDPEKKTLGAADRQPGFVIRMDARLLDRTGGQGSFRTIDSQAVYFMTFDRNEEAWNVRNAIREGKKPPAVFSEIGGRIAKTMSVEIRAPGVNPKSIHPVIQGDGYVSRLESLLLPQILIRAGISADAGFYTYQSEKETIRLRRDFIEQPIGSPGMWRLTTRLADSGVPQVSIYNSKAELVRTELPKGILTEPITLEELASIWRGKNLPMD